MNGYNRAREEGLVGVWLAEGVRRHRQRSPHHPPPIPRHDYQGDGTFDDDGNDRCLECGMGENQGRAKQAHQPVQIDDDTRALADRIVGEHGGT